jgi:Zn-dependent oligopeptidase
MLQPEVLKRLAINKNGEVIPDEMIRKLQESQEIGSSMDTITQMTYARA